MHVNVLMYTCGEGLCVPLCMSVGLWGEIMLEQEPFDSFAGCQSQEAFPLGCS